MTTLRWHTNKLSPDAILIQHDDLVVGMICRIAENWRVEILWVRGDLTFETPSYAAALGFIAGVDMMFATIEGTV